MNRQRDRARMLLVLAELALLSGWATVAQAYEVYSYTEAALHLTGNPVNYLDWVEDNSPVGALARVSENGTAYGSNYSIDASALTHFGYNRLPDVVGVSARRFQADPWRSAFCWNFFPTLYRCGVKPERLARWSGAGRKVSA